MHLLGFGAKAARGIFGRHTQGAGVGTHEAECIGHTGQVGNAAAFDGLEVGLPNAQAGGELGNIPALLAAGISQFGAEAGGRRLGRVGHGCYLVVYSTFVISRNKEDYFFEKKKQKTLTF